MKPQLLRPLFSFAAVLLFAGCSSFTVTDTTWEAPDGFKVWATDYTQKVKPEKAADTVIILPPTGGSTILERKYAAHLSERGQHVIIVQNWTGLDREGLDFDIHNRLFSYANRAIGVAIEKSTGEVKLLGTSLGALYGLSAIARYPKIRKAVLVVSGYPFTSVIARSDYPTMKALREKRREVFKIPDEDAYQAKLESVFTWNDPSTIRSPELERTSLLLFQGERDTTVPVATQQRLAEVLPTARVVKINSGHFWTIVKTYLFHEGEVLDFLAEPAP